MAKKKKKGLLSRIKKNPQALLSTITGKTMKKKKATKQRLDPSCWKGYKKQGTKVKGGTRVNNCVKK